MRIKKDEAITRVLFGIISIRVVSFRDRFFRDVVFRDRVQGPFLSFESHFRNCTLSQNFRIAAIRSSCMTATVHLILLQKGRI